MATSIENLLGYVYLTGLVEDIKTGVPDVLPSAFWTTKSKTIGNQGIYTRYAGTRQTARRAEYGAASHKRALSPIGVFPVTLNHIFEHIDLHVIAYQNLRAYTDYRRQEMGREEVERQIGQFKVLIDNTRLSMVYSMLAQGKIYFDANGNLLPSSSGAVVTIDYGINANNLNQLNGIIGASWATASTDITAHVRALKARARQLTGYPIRYAFYGANIPSYIALNTAAQAYLIRNPAMNQQFLTTNEIPDGFLGLTWIPVYEAFFVDANGNTQTWFNADGVTFTPDIDSSVYEFMEGTYPVPTSFQPTPNPMASFDIKTGVFSYGVPLNDPMTARILAGDTSLPIWKVPDSIFVADTTP